VDSTIADYCRNKFLGDIVDLYYARNDPCGWTVSKGLGAFDTGFIVVCLGAVYIMLFACVMCSYRCIERHRHLFHHTTTSTTTAMDNNRENAAFAKISIDVVNGSPNLCLARDTKRIFVVENP